MLDAHEVLRAAGAKDQLPLAFEAPRPLRVVVGDDDGLAGARGHASLHPLAASMIRSPSSMPSGRHASSKSNFGWWCGQVMSRSLLPPPSMKNAPGTARRKCAMS